MDGLELLKSIKSNIDPGNIPGILLPDKTTLNNKIEGLKNGADAYIEKPFAMPHLLVQINNLLENRIKLRQNFANNPYIATNSMAQNKADEDFLNKALRFVEKNMDNSEYSVDELSDDMAMSRATLFRKMRSVIGMSPTDFIRNTRLKRAAQLITEGRLSVTEIAYSVGYSSPGHFTKSFKKEFGVLPTQYHKT